jgi:hypothetical protein
MVSENMHKNHNNMSIRPNDNHYIYDNSYFKFCFNLKMYFELLCFIVLKYDRVTRLPSDNVIKL